MDALALRYAVRVNGLDGLAVTKLDVLTGFPEIKIAVRLPLWAQSFDEMPSDLETLERCEAVYETLPGWTEKLDGGPAMGRPAEERARVRASAWRSWPA